MRARPRDPRVRRRLAQARDRDLALRPDQGGARLGRAYRSRARASTIDAPTTIVWEHDSGIRGVWDITLAIDMYLRSDYYTNDERWEVTGRKGYARVNRCTGRGIQQPSLEIYADGEMRAYPRARRRLGEQLPRFRTPLAALAPHRRRPVALERRRSRRRVALRARRLREQRSRRHRYRPGVARVALRATVEVAGVEPASWRFDRNVAVHGTFSLGVA